MRVLLADDHHIILYALRALLEANGGFQICGEVHLGRAAIELSREKRPEAVILDQALPDLDGIEVAQQIRRAVPDCKIVFFSQHEDAHLVRRAFQIGARSYIRKCEATDHLVNALKAFRINEPYLTPYASEILLGGIGSPHHSPLLTGRESEVVDLISHGVRRREIARQLSLSAKTIDTHRSAAMKKLGVRNVADLVRHALRSTVVNGS